MKKSFQKVPSNFSYNKFRKPPQIYMENRNADIYVLLNASNVLHTYFKFVWMSLLDKAVKARTKHQKLSKFKNLFCKIRNYKYNYQCEKSMKTKAKMSPQNCSLIKDQDPFKKLWRKFLGFLKNQRKYIILIIFH